jgi:hypothetical protein
MIRIELDEFSIDVPIEKRMTVQQFLAIADRLERISKRQKPAADAWGFSNESAPIYDMRDTMHQSSGASSHDVAHDDFRFEHETQGSNGALERVSRQLDGISEMLMRLEKLERRLDEQHR